MRRRPAMAIAHETTYAHILHTLTHTIAYAYTYLHTLTHTIV
jgi:hypothetical protein